MFSRAYRACFALAHALSDVPIQLYILLGHPVQPQAVGPYPLPRPGGPEQPGVQTIGDY